YFYSHYSDSHHFYSLSLHDALPILFPALLLLKKLRARSEELGSLTIPQFLGQHFNSDGVRIIIALAICIFYLLPLVAQFKGAARSEEHTSELQSRFDLVCRLLLEIK